MCVCVCMYRAGANLIENASVSRAELDRETGLWTVHLEDSEVTYSGRVLVCADGAPSKLAGQLGLVTQPPQGTCSRSYVEADTHHFQADGVLFYSREVLPGLSLLPLYISLSAMKQLRLSLWRLFFSVCLRLRGTVPSPQQRTWILLLPDSREPQGFQQRPTVLARLPDEE